MKVFLTGATGFIGSYILKAIQSGGFETMALYRNENKIDRSLRCAWLKLDENWQARAREFAPDVVIHTAWHGVTVAERSDWGVQIGNVEFQQQLLALNPRQYIALGSQAEYGTYDAVVNEDYPTNPTSAYGAVKLACLDIARSYCALNKIDWQWFRVFSTFGPGEASTWLIPSAINKMRSEQSMDTTFGEQRYSYLYVGEIARVVVRAICSGAPSGVYCLSGSKTISIRELLEKIRDRVNPEFVLHFGAIPYRDGQSMMMGCDNRRVSKALCAIQDLDFEDRLNETIDSYI